MAKYMRIDLTGKAGQEEMEETYNLFVKTVSCRPYASVEGIHGILKEIGKKNPKAQVADPHDFTNTRILKELETTGYIDSACK